MNKKVFQDYRILFLTGVILVAALLRLIPHPENVAPVAAIALFAGAFFKNRIYAFFVPIACLFFSDFLFQLQYWTGIREYPGFYTLMPVVYLAFAFMVVCGLWIQKKGVSVKNIVLATLAGSIAFFIITNFAVWIMNPQASLIQTYTQAIPFFRNTLAGNFFYVTSLFGLYAIVKAKVPKLGLA